jgi:uncharacterized RDD family membrane protein YckC
MADETAPWASRLLSLYPTSQLPRPALDTAGDRSVVLDRMLAAGFDVFVCLFVVEAPLLFIADALTAGLLRDSPLFFPITFLALAPLVVTYSFAFEWRYARTPGKVWRGLVTVTDEGEHPSVVATGVRNLLRYVDYLGVPPVVLGVATALASADGKRLGDYAGRTVVVRTR